MGEGTSRDPFSPPGYPENRGFRYGENGVIPTQYRSAIEKAIRLAYQLGFNSALGMHNIRVGGLGNREAEVHQVVVGSIDGTEDKDGGHYHGGRLCYAQRKALDPIAVRICTGSRRKRFRDKLFSTLISSAWSSSRQEELKNRGASD